MKSIIALCVTLLSINSFAGVVKVNPDDLVKDPTLSPAETERHVGQLTRMIRKNVAGMPGDFNVIEGNRLMVIQSNQDVCVAGNFFIKGETVDALDVVVKADEQKFHAWCYNTAHLPEELVTESLSTVIENSLVPTFMKKKRYLGFVQADKSLANNKKQLESFYSANIKKAGENYYCATEPLKLEMLKEQIENTESSEKQKELMLKMNEQTKKIVELTTSQICK